MRWRVVVELAGADGAQQVHEVGAGERPPTDHTAATLGLGLEEGKTILAAVQRHLVVPELPFDRATGDRPEPGGPTLLDGTDGEPIARPCHRRMPHSEGARRRRPRAP